MGFYVLTERRK